MRAAASYGAAEQRQSSYAVTDEYEGEEVSNEQPIQRRAGRIKYRDVCTPQWFELGEVLRWLSKQVGVEDGGRAQGAIGHVGETLWDAEGEHLVCRCIVDLAKVSVLVRLMHDYMRWRCDEALRGEAILALTRSSGQESILTDEGKVIQLCDDFEESLGLVLAAVLRWKEAMQLSEPRVLIQHCAGVLQALPLTGEDPKRALSKQSHMIFHYLQALGRHLEELATSELLGEMQAQRLVPLVVHDIHRRAAFPECTPSVQLALAALSALADNEDFQTDWQVHFGPGDLERFVALEPVVQGLVAKAPELRRDLRPLTDLLNRAKRAS